MSDLTIGGETFRVAFDGNESSPALLLCHPLGGDHRIWDAQVPELAQQFRVIRYDARGHGGSTTAGAPYSIVRLGLDALAILDALEIEKAHVLGMSMGGAVAQWLLIHAPHRVERGILANTGATFTPAASWNERIVTVHNDGMEGLCEPTMARWFGDAFIAQHPAVVDAVKQTFLGTAPEGYAASCGALRDADLREGLRQIPNSVLVIAGRHDPSVGQAATDLLAETIPDATLVTLDAYHIANLGDAAGFTKAVLDFLTAAPPRQGSVRKSSPRLPVARRPAGRRTAATRGTAAPRPAPTAPAKRKKTSPPAKAPVSATAPTPEKPTLKKPMPRRGRPAAASKTSATAKTRTGGERKAMTRSAQKPTQSPAKREHAALAKKAQTPTASPSRSKAKPPVRVTSKPARQSAAAKPGRPKASATKVPVAKARAPSRSAAKAAAKPAVRKTPAKAAAAKAPIKAPTKTSTRPKAKAVATRPARSTNRRKK